MRDPSVEPLALGAGRDHQERAARAGSGGEAVLELPRQGEPALDAARHPAPELHQGEGIADRLGDLAAAADVADDQPAEVVAVAVPGVLDR